MLYEVITLISISLLMCSNVFMTFAWYAHLKDMSHKPWFIRNNFV